MSGHGEKRTRQQDHAVAPLLSAPTVAAAAAGGRGRNPPRRAAADRWPSVTHLAAGFGIFGATNGTPRAAVPGLTPASRQRLRVELADKEPDELEMFLNRESKAQRSFRRA